MMHMIDSHTFRWATAAGRRLSLAVAVSIFSLCAFGGDFRDANRAFERGDYVNAVDAYRRAAEAEPDNVVYQQRYLLRRREALQHLFAAADRARTQGDLAAAETLYQNALQVEPGNALAADWMRRIADMRRHGEQLSAAEEMISSGNLAEAERLVRKVLSEAPDQPRALSVLERIRDKRRSDGGTGEESLEQRYRKPVTLEFRDVPVKVAFDVLSKASGINFVYDQEIRPDLKVTLFLRKTPLEDAIRMIGLSTQLETRAINANSVLVYPNTPQKVGEYRPLRVRSFYLKNADAKQLAETLKTMLKIETITVDEKLNMVMIRDSEDAIRLAEKIVALHDIGEPEVMLDVAVMEVKQSKLLDAGVNLPSEVGVSLVAPGQTSNSIPLDALRDITSSSIYALIPNGSVKLRDERSGAKILANPKIRVKTRQKASVLIGDRVPVITSTSTSTGFVSETVNYVDVGLKLEVEPAIYAGDDVSIKINLEVSNLVREIVSRSGTLSYQIGTRNAQTTLRLRDGETQILAGLIDKEDRRVASGLPWISRFPVLSRIFGSQKDDRQKTEIVLSITPHLIRGVRQMDLEDMEFGSGTATHLVDTDAIAPDAPASGDGDEGAGTDAQVQTATTTSATPIPAASAGASGLQPGTPQTTASPPAAMPGVQLQWQAPPQVRVGEQFTVSLDLTAARAISQLPLVLGYDPSSLQLVRIDKGGFAASGSNQTQLNHQVDLPSGKIIANASWPSGEVSGQGTLLQLTFKAIAQSEHAVVRVFSATPAPAADGVVRLPEVVIQVK